MVNLFEVHPATALWWEQRDKCRGCAHHFRFTLKRRYGDDVGGERCKACPAERGKRDFLYCIDARLEGGPCGPDAKLFVPRALPIVIYKTGRTHSALKSRLQQEIERL